MPASRGLIVTILMALACGVSALDPTGAAPIPWDNGSDTWVATDALGRPLPTHPEVALPRQGKTVGIFYFLWLGQHGRRGPFDISRILAENPGAINDPASPLWGPLYVPHHWGESIFGYYVFDDAAVLRKHAQMLSDAGVDVVIFDVTNQETYPGSWQALCRTWDAMRKDGNRTPQIAFLTPFWNPRKVVRELWDQLYSRNLYPDLWFRWEGKPLILADPQLLDDGLTVHVSENPVELKTGHSLGQSIAVEKSVVAIGASLPTWTKRDSQATLTLRRGGPDGEIVSTRRVDLVVDNAWATLEFAAPLTNGTYYLELSAPKGQVGWWSTTKNSITNGQAYVDGQPAAGDRSIKLALADDPGAHIKNFFTFRKPQPDYFVGPTGPNQWSWLEVYPQHVFTNSAGQAEQIGVGVAQNAVDGKLSVLSNPRGHGRSFHNGKEPGAEGRDFSGRNFSEQWRRAFEIDPAFIFITGWNEWIAGRFDIKAPFHAPGPVTFVDQFNQEFSRDIEPMKGGHGDNYYYQMVANIRRYKGARAIPAVEPKPIRIDGHFEDWSAVQPEFRDTVGDPMRRDHESWRTGDRYVNKTGRNDIICAKASYDSDNACFYAKTQEHLSSERETNWMLLFIDADANPTNGWLGYDFVVNRTRMHQTETFIERNLGGYKWGDGRVVKVHHKGNEIELAIPWQILGSKAAIRHIDFKWADNIQQTGDWSDLTLNGDAAPNDRYNYRALIQ